MNEDTVRAAAKLLADAWRDMTTIEALPPALRPRNFEEAYAIQDEMAALIGKTTAGWKIGPASPGLMRAEGFRRTRRRARVRAQHPSQPCRAGSRAHHERQARVRVRLEAQRGRGAA